MKNQRPFALVIALIAFPLQVFAQFGGELRFALRGEPKTMQPHAAIDEPSETVSYLTRGVLLRINRQSHEIEPQLAESWQVSEDGRKIEFILRSGLRFSDGSPLDSEDIRFTFDHLSDLEIASVLADPFRFEGGELKVETPTPRKAVVIFPKPVAAAERLFDSVAILSSRAKAPEQSTAGPFVLKDYRPGAYVLLERNPHYWKQDASGRKLPYLDSVRLTIQNSGRLEALRFRRGQYDLMNGLDPDVFDNLAAANPGVARDAGPSLDIEFLWFNLHPDSPLPSYKKAWFSSVEFRQAIANVVRRDDIARIVYQGHATPALGPVSPANRSWFNGDLPAYEPDLEKIAERLKKAGFKRQGDQLIGPRGRPVEFSLITNAGNTARKQMSAMIQQDLSEIGVRLNLVSLDFQSLIERITATFDYELCLLGFVNTDLDPNAQMNFWLSSARNHAWHPGQKSPSTPWEARIDEIMRGQASQVDPDPRRTAFNEVQKIAREQSPVVYLVHKNSLGAASTRIRNIRPAALWPSLFWNIEELHIADKVSNSR